MGRDIVSIEIALEKKLYFDTFRILFIFVKDLNLIISYLNNNIRKPISSEKIKMKLKLIVFMI
jgi:hypothetical protein